jgi:hypothetical protein
LEVPHETHGSDGIQTATNGVNVDWLDVCCTKCRLQEGSAIGQAHCPIGRNHVVVGCRCSHSAAIAVDHREFGGRKRIRGHIQGITNLSVNRQGLSAEGGNTKDAALEFIPIAWRGNKLNNIIRASGSLLRNVRCHPDHSHGHRIRRSPRHRIPLDPEMPPCR